MASKKRVSFNRLLLAATGKNKILLAPLDLLIEAAPDAVRARGHTRS